MFLRVLGDKPNFFSLLSIQIVSEELEAFHPLHCGPINVDRGVLPLLFPEVHNHLLCFVDVE
jgi:hypothetical protein